jgi:hypothetical protein
MQLRNYLIKVIDSRIVLIRRIKTDFFKRVTDVISATFFIVQTNTAAMGNIFVSLNGTVYGY